MAHSDLRGPSDPQGATDCNQLPSKTRNKNQTLQASGNQAKLDTLTREASGDCARSQKPLALSFLVWELSVTYDHSCDTALQCKVTHGQGVGLVCARLCAGAMHTEAECVLHSPGPFHACLAPPQVSWVGKRVKLASSSSWKLKAL